MEFDEVPPRWYRRMIMIAPLLVGVVVAIGVLGSGLWTGLAQAEPHYLDEFLILNWIVFVIPSPTDVRGFINPKTSETTAAD